jgi:predicted nucleic acid-binding protein
MARSRLPYDGQRLLVDTSAFSAIRRAKGLNSTPPEWTEARLRKQLLLSPIVKLELLHEARSAGEFEDLDNFLGYYPLVPLRREVFDAAMGAVRDLAAVSPEYHRVGVCDALIAASAAMSNVGVLHYNHKHFAKLREVLVFNNVELAPPGTFERN